MVFSINHMIRFVGVNVIMGPTRSGKIYSAHMCYSSQVFVSVGMSVIKNVWEVNLVTTILETCTILNLRNWSKIFFHTSPIKVLLSIYANLLGVDYKLNT